MVWLRCDLSHSSEETKNIPRMAFHLKLIQPKVLPASGVTSAEFKPWQNHVVNFLQQDVDNFRFLKNGKYSTWLPLSENGRRIDELVLDDEDKVAIEAEENVTNATKTLKKTQLLDKRNGQLSKLLQHIVSFVNYTEADDVDQNSTSMEWIFSYLRETYDIAAKGSNFLKITEHTYKTGVPFQVYLL